MAYRLWLLKIEGVSYRVQMNHRLFTGELNIQVDGKTIHESVRDAAYTTSHGFRLPNFWAVNLQICSIGMDCFYQLWLEGRLMEPAKDSDTLLRGSSCPTDNLLRPAVATMESDKKELLRPPDILRKL